MSVNMINDTKVSSCVCRNKGDDVFVSRRSYNSSPKNFYWIHRKTLSIRRLPILWMDFGVLYVSYRIKKL